MREKTIGCIGAGNMGYAMMNGMAKNMENPIIFSQRNEEKLKKTEKELGIKGYVSNQDVVDEADIVILAIKPQYFKEILFPLHFRDEQILISIAPGFEIEKINALINSNSRIIRAMPNTPALIGEAMSAISFDRYNYQEEEKEVILSIFTSFGEIVEMTESLMDAIVPVAGSAPAYVYMMIEAMADAAVAHGIQREMAYKLAAQTIQGSARMVLKTKEHPGKLKDNVCSPKGTTIEAVRILEKNGFRSSIIEAMDACYHKAKNM